MASSRFSSKVKKVTAEIAERIRTSKASRRIVYPTFSDVFDYVHSIYPKSNVRQAHVYHITRALMSEIGFYSVGGFFDNEKKIVVITDQVHSDSDYWEIKAEYELDEVLCHELIHYAANAKLPMSDVIMEEELAYGHSINYLRRKRSDDFIIRKNMMPYLINLVDKASIIRKIFCEKYGWEKYASLSPKGLELAVKDEKMAIQKELIEQAYQIGLKIVNSYGNTRVEEKIIEKPLFRRMDLSDDI